MRGVVALRRAHRLERQAGSWSPSVGGGDGIAAIPFVGYARSWRTLDGAEPWGAHGTLRPCEPARSPART